MKKFLTPDDIQAAIVSAHYFTAENGARDANLVLNPAFDMPEGFDRVTFCVLVLKNGAKVIGINYGAIDPARHSAEMGRDEARKDAESKIWELLGFELRTRLQEAGQ